MLALPTSDYIGGLVLIRGSTSDGGTKDGFYIIVGYINDRFILDRSPWKKGIAGDKCFHIDNFMAADRYVLYP
jgi:hypothetical protein